MSLRQYAALWRVPGGPVLLVGGVLARLGQGVTIFTWLLLVEATTGSYAAAGLVTAATAAATAVAAPVGGRLADRFGPARLLPWYAAVYSATQLLLLVAVLARQPTALLCALAAVSGAAFPAVSPALRSTWVALTSPASGRGHARVAAMAAESVLFEVVFVVGPLLLSGTMLLAPVLARTLDTEPSIAGPGAALAAAAVTTLLGTVWVARGSGMRSVPPSSRDDRTHGLGPLSARGFGALLLVAAGVAFSFGGTPVAIAAYAGARDGADAARVTGLLIAVWSIGSALAGFWYGTTSFVTPLPRQLVVLLLGLAAGYAAWTLAPSSLVLGAVLFVTGAVIAPAMTVMASLVARITPSSMLTEAYTWLTTTNLTAAALGSAVTGVLVDRPGGVVHGFLAAAAAAALAAGVAAWPGALRPRPAAPDLSAVP